MEGHRSHAPRLLPKIPSDFLGTRLSPARIWMLSQTDEGFARQDPDRTHFNFKGMSTIMEGVFYKRYFEVG